MGRGSLRTSFTGSALIRLLAQLADAEAPESKQAFAERLSQWLGWTDAISLSAALNTPAAPAAGPRAAPLNKAEADVARVRAALTRAITEEGASAAPPPPAPGEPVDPKAEFAVYRRRYVARQQAMEAGIAPLRERLRGTLAGVSAEMARLAAVDAVMEQVLRDREHVLLAGVPRLLEKRFERLCRAEADAPADGASPGGWHDVFASDLQRVLLAELEVRLQPVEGLLDALRARPDKPT